MSIAEARQLDHAVPLCVALAWASLNTYLTSPDDLETEALANELVDYAGKYAVESYHGFGLSMQALCRIRRGEGDTAWPRSTAVWRNCQRRDTGSSIGSCKQSLQGVRPSPVSPGKDLQSSNEQRSILTTPNGTLRNCVVSGANWPLATTRDLRLAGSISQCTRTIGQTSELVVGAQGRDQPCYCRKVGRAKRGRVADLTSHASEISRGV